jgi:adenylate cyclase
MGLKEDITTTVKGIIDTNVSIQEVNYVPELSDSKLTFAGAGLKFHTAVLYIDMRDSTKVLNKHNRPTIAKIHKAYLHTTVKIATSLGGEVRSFNGDSVLAFFPGNTIGAINSAVKAAMQICYMITNKESGINELLSRFSAVNFGIGIDFGKILCTKIGVGRDNNTQDLIWIGNGVNKAVVISDDCEASYHVGISSIVYNNLSDDVKYHKHKDAYGYERSVDMWTRYTIDYNGEKEFFYKTNYYYIM